MSVETSKMQINIMQRPAIGSISPVPIKFCDWFLLQLEEKLIENPLQQSCQKNYVPHVYVLL